MQDFEKVDYYILEKVLNQVNITLEEYAKFAHIPLEAIKQWEKEGKIPAFAIVIAREMVKNRRKPEKGFDRYYYPAVNLTEEELKQIKTAFWGMNYTPHFILWVVKKLQKNIPDKLFQKIIKTDVFSEDYKNKYYF
jgi:hypothetical protein